MSRDTGGSLKEPVSRDFAALVCIQNLKKIPIFWDFFYFTFRNVCIMKEQHWERIVIHFQRLEESR